jgi:hypothetical protein
MAETLPEPYEPSRVWAIAHPMDEQLTKHPVVSHRIVPGEVTFMVLLLLACDFITRTPSWEQNSERQMLMGIVYDGVPTIVLSSLVLLSREGKRPEFKQWHYVFGTPWSALFQR